MSAAALDLVLDRSIALGYGRPGLAIRRRLPGWPADPPRMDGRTVLVTGAASGLGLAACVGFARLGARILAVARSPERAREACERIQGASAAADVRALVCDVSRLASLEELVAGLVEDGRPLHVLVNNAGAMPSQRTLTEDGVELTFATSVLAPFVLTDRLAALLAAGGDGRVINVSSGGMYARRLAADDLQARREPYSPRRVYAAAKRAEAVLTGQWARRLDGRGVVVHAMHPGWADTPGLRDALPGFHRLVRPILRSAAEGADTIVWLGGAQEAGRCTGLLWHDRRPRPLHYRRSTQETEADRRRLWQTCEELAGGLRS